MSAAHSSLSIAQKPVDTGFWGRQLGYSHAVVAVVAAFVIGSGLHFATGSRFQNPTALLIFGAIPLLVMIIAGRTARKNRVVIWLTGIPMAIVSTAATGVFALVGGVVPQKDLARFGIENLWGSWPFLLVSLLFLLNLVGSSSRRAWPLNYVNVVYLTTHAGLALAIIGGAISSAMLDRTVLVLFENTPTSKSETRDGESRVLPFTATLRKFELESFAPTLALVSLDAKGEMKFLPGSELLKAGSSEEIGGYEVRTKSFFPRAVFAGESWTEVPWKSAGPAAEIEVRKHGKVIKSGWVAAGSLEAPATFLELDHGVAFAMPDPRPKKFQSVVEFKDATHTWSETIEVNNPAHVGGYDLYQISYDDKMGAASEYSVLEVVQDKGIRVVYAGIFTLIAGCVLHLWNGIGGKR